MSLMKSEKFFEITDAYNKLTKQDLNNRVKRAVRRHIRNTEYFDLAKDGSYIRVLSIITDRSIPTITAYLSSYDKVGIYKNKLLLIHLAKISNAFNVSLEYLISLTESDKPTSTAQEYIDLYEIYNNTNKLVVADNVRLFKSNEVNGICTNLDIANLLGISDNAVKANISTGKRAMENKFSIEHLYKLANAWGVEIDRLFNKAEE